MEPRTCRLCQGPLLDRDLLTLDHAPAGAQLFRPPGEGDRTAVIALHVVQCSSCGLVQLTADPVPYYRETITAADLSSEMRTIRLGQFKKLMYEFPLSGRLIA